MSAEHERNHAMAGLPRPKQDSRCIATDKFAMPGHIKVRNRTTSLANGQWVKRGVAV